MLKDLDASMEDVTLKVRVIRMWRLPDKNNKTQDYSIEIILADEQGSRIYGNVVSKWFSRFEHYLKDNACLFIKKPSLGIYNAEKKYVDNQFKLCLNFHTHISKCVDFDGPEYGFKLVSFRSILDKEISESLTLDVIGHVTNIFPEDKKDGNQTTKMTMQIEDLEGNHVFLTLWETYSRQMEKYVLDNKTDEYVVLVLQFARVKWYKDSPYVQNSWGGKLSRLLINTDIDEIRKYRKSLIKRAADTPSLNHRPLRLSMVCSLDDEFLTRVPFTSIFEICEITEEKHVIIVGTIKAICQEAGWKYDACKKCHHKVVEKWLPRLKADGSDDLEEENADYCNKCCARVVSKVPKLKIQVRVQDVTGVVSLTLFDRHLMRLVQTTAVELVEINKTEDDVLYFPEVFNSLLDKKFAFKIEVGQYNLTYNYPVYGVIKLTDEVTIISELEKRLIMLQSNESESVNMSISEFKSQDTVVNKESSSYICDNETPLSNVKRKLVDLYDIEESSSMSEVKTRLIEADDKGDLDEKVKSEGDDKGDLDEKVKFEADDKVKYLTPKVEK